MQMKTLFASVILITAILACGCQGGTEIKNIETRGYLGQLPALKAMYKAQDSVLTAKAKTRSKSVDDLVKVQSEINILKEKSKTEFATAAARLGLPINIPFIDSTGNTTYVVKSLKITKAEWDGITFTADVELKTNSGKTMGGQNIPLTVPALLLDENNSVLNINPYETWMVMSVSKEMKAGEIQQVTGAIPVTSSLARMKTILFKSNDAFKEAKGWN